MSLDKQLLAIPLVLFISTISFFPTLAESGELKRDTIIANNFLNKADSLAEIGNWKAGQHWMYQASQIYKTHQVWPKYVACLNSIARNLDALDSLSARMSIIEQAIQVAETHLDPKHSSLADTYQQKAEVFLKPQLQNLDSTHYYIDKAIDIAEQEALWERLSWSLIIKAVYSYHKQLYVNMEKELQQVAEIADCQVDDPNELYRTIFHLQGVCWKMTGAYEKAMMSYQKALTLFVSMDRKDQMDSMFMATNYDNLGGVYYNKGDFEKAIQCYEIALKIRQEIQDANRKLIGSYNNLGLAFQKTQAFEEAEYYFTQSLSLLPKQINKKNHKQWIRTYGIWANLKIDQADYDSALIVLQQILPYAKTFNYHEYWVYRRLGIVMQKKRDYKQALQYFEQALARQHAKSRKRHVDIAAIYNLMAEVKVTQDKPEAALLYYQKALVALSSNFLDLDYFANPPLEEVGDYQHLLVALSGKLSLLSTLDHHRACEESILETFNLANQVIDRMYRDYESREAKLLLRTKAKIVYEAEINFLYCIYEKYKDPVYLNRIFQFMEKSKSLLLLETVRKSKSQVANSDSGLATDEVFQTLLEEERAVNRDLVYYRQKLSALHQGNIKKNKLKVENVQAIKAELNLRKQDLQKRFATAYPSYFQLTYDNKIAGINDIQSKLLHRGQAFIEYFLGEHHVFVISITPQSSRIYQIPKTQHVETLLTDLRHLQGTNPFIAAPDQARKHFEQFTQTSYQLYQQLLQPVLDELPSTTIELFLIPDGELGYISFEALLTEAPQLAKVSYRLQELSFLIKDWTLQYGYSGTLLLESLRPGKKKKNRRDYVGYAPVFDHVSDQIAAERGFVNAMPEVLKYSEVSVSESQLVLGGDLFLRSQASKQDFLQQAANYKIVHLSTHATVDESNPDFNQILFADGALSTYEVYNMNLNADLVVLSACETGYGELSKGEGIMSLARGFLHAGSASVLTSLWQASDHATAQIMVDFHKNLKKGQPKATALRNAKLKYLQHVPDLQTPPSFWATFVLIGDLTPVRLKSAFWTPWHSRAGLILIALGIVCCLGYYLRKNSPMKLQYKLDHNFKLYLGSIRF